MAKKTVIEARKKPKQKRSQQTVAAILEVAARILVSDGYDKLNTNRVAQVAGVSIGSLYQYFPNKQTLIRALAEAHLSEEIQRLASMTEDLLQLPLEEATRQCVRALFEAFHLDFALHRALVINVIHLGDPLAKKLQQQAEMAVHFALEARRKEILPKDLKLAAFFLVSAVDSIVVRAMTLAEDRIVLADLEDEICLLVLRYLTGVA